jgi:hypothetical protein
VVSGGNFLIKVATTHLDLVPVKIGAGEKPFGDAGIGSVIDKMLSVTVMHIGQSLVWGF